jgi:hypothetical protein
MKNTERKAVKGLSERAHAAWEILTEREKSGYGGFGAIPELCRNLEADPITFIVFSCLASVRGAEKLILNLSLTMFFRLFRRQTEPFLQTFLAKGLPVQLVVVLPDTEPRETWGWKVPQEELTKSCRQMVDNHLLPCCKVLLWSDLVTQSNDTFEQALVWAEKSASPLIIKQEIDYMKTSSAYRDIFLGKDLRQTAIRQAAAYALQGKVLEQLYPQAILLQSELPTTTKDKMYNPLRTNPLPVLHPFTFSKEGI